MKIFIILLMLLASIPYSFAQSQCDYQVEVLVNGSEFGTNEFAWRMRAFHIQGKSTNITGIAKIKDIDGNVIKKYAPWTNDSISKQKTSSEYSPNLKEGEYKIISEIDVECDDTNKNNNIVAKTIKIKPDIKNEVKAIAPLQDIPILKNEDKGQITQTIIANDSVNSSQNITAGQNKNPIPNSVSEEQIKDKETDNVIYSSPKEIQNSKITPTADAVKEFKIIYESGNEKAKNMVIFFLLGLSILLNVVLIWKR